MSRCSAWAFWAIFCSHAGCDGGSPAAAIATCIERSAVTAKLADAAYALPLVAVYALGAYGLVPLLAGELAALAKGLRAMTTLQVVSQCATLAFMALQLVLFAVPRLP